MRVWNLRVLIFAMLVLLAACGQKGQLYLPGPAQTDMSIPEEGQSGGLQPENVGETDDLEVKKDKNG